MTKIIEHNIETGEIVDRDMNAEELAQWKDDLAKATAKSQAQANADLKRLAALAKLEVLGLDENDLKAIGI